MYNRPLWKIWKTFENLIENKQTILYLKSTLFCVLSFCRQLVLIGIVCLLRHHRISAHRPGEMGVVQQRSQAPRDRLNMERYIIYSWEQFDMMKVSCKIKLNKKVNSYKMCWCLCVNGAIDYFERRSGVPSNWGQHIWENNADEAFDSSCFVLRRNNF